MTRKSILAKPSDKLKTVQLLATANPLMPLKHRPLQRQTKPELFQLHASSLVGTDFSIKGGMRSDGPRSRFFQ
ncbi:hypothetical protein [Bythopirellula polymerisocia]|uniref:hypothetical protein n=1 Tax=Bythopirellula polymerisocia TaxID=2528003 RepID=UPI0011B5DCE6|nr:hypothetical protein [Bythopirellula polymerisocia]